MSIRKSVSQLPLFTLACACGVLFLLWLPVRHHPIVSDTAQYALLGQSLWEHGTYSLLGEPYAKHLPFHAFVSYPFTAFFGFGLGMKFSSLIAGWGVLLASFLVMRRMFSLPIALGTVGALLLHHGFILMATLGSADLLFAALLFFSLYFYLKAEDDDRMYLGAYIALGLACLTRYNGVPFFGLYLFHTILFRKDHRLSVWCWSSCLIGAAVFGSWFVRNMFTFGNPLYTEYTTELTKEVPSLISQLVSNSVYYVQPQQNILPILFIFALYGLYKFGTSQKFLIVFMLCAWLMTAVWWVQAMRFAFPGYIILIGFSVAAVVHVYERLPRAHYLFLSLIIVGVCMSHAAAICLYTYGECNSYFDRTIGGIPQNLGLSSEGLFTWDRARDYLNENAEPDAAVYVHNPVVKKIWQQDNVFRDDLLVTDDAEGSCTLYRLTQEVIDTDTILYQTADHPITYVVLDSCS